MPRTLCAVLTLVACSGGSAPPPEPTGEISRAEELAANLDPAKIAKTVDALKGGGSKTADALRFPIQEVTVPCRGEHLHAMYDPYRDVLALGSSSPDTIREYPRSISFDGKRAWAPADKFDPGTNLIVTGEGETPEKRAALGRLQLHKLGEKYAKWFPPDRDVEVSVAATMIAAKSSSDSKFEYVPREHRGWKLKLHVFSPAMTNDLVAHAARLTKAGLELDTIKAHDFTANLLRSNKAHPKIGPVVARYDELVAAAQKQLEAAGEVPHAKYKTALSLACEDGK